MSLIVSFLSRFKVDTSADRIAMLNNVLRYACVLACLVGSTLVAAATRPLLYVGNSRGDDISVIDLNALRVVGDIKVGENVHGVTLLPDGSRLFVTIESNHTLRTVDTASGKVIGTVQLTGRPNQCAVTPDGKYVVVPIRDGDSVDIVDVAQQKVAKVLPIKEPHNALDTGSNRYVFVSSMGSHEINVIDLAKMEFSAVLPAGGRPRPYVVSSDGKTMYVAVSNLNGFVIVDIPDKKVVQRVEIPAEYQGPPPPRKYETPDTYTHGLALSPNGRELWVTSLLDNAMYVYNLDEKKVVAHVPTGKGPNWVVFSPNGKYVCVSNTDSNDVSIIDADTYREVTKIKVGDVPKRIAAVVSNVP